MLITGKHSLSTIVRYLADIALILNVLVLIFLPFILTALYENPQLLVQLDRAAAEHVLAGGLASDYPSDLPPESYSFYLGFLYASGLGTALILSQGHRILKRFERGQPFAQSQAGAFRVMSIAFFWLVTVFLVKVFFYITLLTLFCFLLFLFFGVVCLILADVFRQAWQVQTENDMTI